MKEGEAWNSFFERVKVIVRVSSLQRDLNWVGAGSLQPEDRRWDLNALIAENRSFGDELAELSSGKTTFSLVECLSCVVLGERLGECGRGHVFHSSPVHPFASARTHPNIQGIVHCWCHGYSNTVAWLRGRNRPVKRKMYQSCVKESKEIGSSAIR